MAKGNHALVEVDPDHLMLAPVHHPVRAEGVRLLWGNDDSGWKYSGEAADLIAAGLALREWLPGEPGCPYATAFTFLRGGRCVRIVKNTASRFLVQIDADIREREAEDKDCGAAIRDEDEDWPPHVAHNPAITIGDGTRFHYLALPHVMLLEGLLDADDIPGNIACKYKFRTAGWIDGKRAFQAVRLGGKIALTVLTNEASIIRCPALKFTPQ
jgi:hypothetical protein